MQNPDNLLAAIRRVLISSARTRQFDQIPVFCGSSLKNKGVGNNDNTEKIVYW